MLLISYKVFDWLRMIKIVPLFPVTLIAVYLSGGLNVGFNIANMKIKNEEDEKAQLDRRTVFTVSPVNG